MDVLTKEEKEFSLKAQVGAALKRQGLQDSHVIWETPKGGFIGIEKEDPRTEQDHSIPKEPTKKKKYLCKVYRANCDEENMDLVIKVTANGPHERAVFKPGEEKDLTETQINILKDAVLDSRIEIELTSGIYSAVNPEAAAKAQYPAFQVEKDPYTGRIAMVQHLPKFIIEYLGDRPQAA